MMPTPPPAMPAGIAMAHDSAGLVILLEAAGRTIAQLEQQLVERDRIIRDLTAPTSPEATDADQE